MQKDQLRVYAGQLPCWVPQRVVASAFGYDAAGIDLALQGGYGQDRPYLWATEFENVHTNWDFREPSVTVFGKHYACSEDAYHAQKPEPFDQAVWDKRKVHVMLEAVLSKFRAVGATGDSLRELLLSTHPHPLLGIKGDTFWGFNPAKGGENMLGVLLMRIREDMATAMWAWHRGNTIVGRRRCQRLKCFTTEQNTGNCFVAAAVTHMSGGATVVPTIESIRDLQRAAGLSETGYTTDKEMVQLLEHLRCCCVTVQPSGDTATILNAASNHARCITAAMHGTSHVEPVILGGAVQVRRLSEVVALLHGHGVHMPLAGQHARATEADAAEQGETPTFAAPVPAAAPTFEHVTSTEKQDVMDELFEGDWPSDEEPAARALDEAQLEEAAHAGELSTLNLSKLDILEFGGVKAVKGGGQQATTTFSHMATPSRKPTVRDVHACSAKDAAGEAAAGGDLKSCYNFSEGDIVQVSWGKRKKRTEYAATVVAIDHNKKTKPVHVTFGPGGNAWVSAESVVKQTNDGGTGFTPPAPGCAGLRTLAAGGLAARAELVYRGSQHCRTNEAVGEVPASDMDGTYGIDRRTHKPYLATYVARHGVEPHASNMTAVAPAIGATGLLAGGVHRGGVKGIKPVGCEVMLQGGAKSVFVDCCGMCGRVGSRNRELRDCRWTTPC